MTIPDTSRAAIERLCERMRDEDAHFPPITKIISALLAFRDALDAAERDAAEALALADARCQEKAFAEDALATAERERDQALSDAVHAINRQRIAESALAQAEKERDEAIAENLRNREWARAAEASCLKDRAERDAARDENARLREAAMDALSSLVAAHSLLSRGGKKSAPSDKMFEQMLKDYGAAIARTRAALTPTEPSGG